MVEIAFLDRPKNGIDDVAMATPLLHTAVTTGVLHKEIAKILQIVTGIKPKLSQPTMKSKVIEQWPVKKCEGHMKDIVRQFSLHYTRNQVERGFKKAGMTLRNRREVDRIKSQA